MKNVALWMLQRSGLLALERARTRNAFRIVTYHGVDERDHPVLNADRLQTPPTLFSRQIEALAREYRIVELGTAVRFFLEHGRWPERGLAITFDDGYRNNLEQAAPILTRIGVPATFFVTASFVEGRSEPWWYVLRQAIAARYASAEQAAAEAVRLEAVWRPLSERERSRKCSELCRDDAREPLYYPFMTCDEVMRLAGLGFDVQPHGDLHLSFKGESPEQLEPEIRKSVDFVRALTGRSPWGFAYPYGHLPAARASTEAVFAGQGIMAAFGTREGNNRAEADRWALRRWDLHGGYSPAAACARVAGVTRLRPRGSAA